MLLRMLNVLLAPTTPVTTSNVNSNIGSGNMGKEDIIDFLGKDDIPLDTKDNKSGKDIIPLEDDETDETDDKEDKPKKSKFKDKDDDKTDDDKTDDEDDELKDLEDELEDPSDEQLELVTPVRRKEILAKYPKLFKDFPYLEKAYYREQQYTKILPTIDDAKEALSKAETLDKFENDLADGNITTMLSAVSKADKNAFYKMADNWMLTLKEVDEKAYNNVLGNVIKHTIMAMVGEAKASNNDALRDAAAILNQYAFASSNFIPPRLLSETKSDNKNTDRDDKLTARENAFAKQKLDNAVEDLDTRVNTSYKSTIEAYIDPKGSMTDFVKKNAIREAVENLEELISRDDRFKILTDKLWARASQDDYSKDSIKKIQTAFITKAKTLLPSVIKKARQEALRGNSGRNTNNDDKDDKTDKVQRKEPSRSNRSDHSKSNVPKGMSTLDYLMADDN